MDHEIIPAKRMLVDSLHERLEFDAAIAARKHHQKLVSVFRFRELAFGADEEIPLLSSLIKHVLLGAYVSHVVLCRCSGLQRESPP